ncbi:MAG: hypothetical protein ACI9A7_000313 [Cyclobacteriaceae bacterium]|jgi:hypothetical protein
MDDNGQLKAPLYLLFLGVMALLFFAVGMLFPTEPHDDTINVENKPLSTDGTIEEIVKEGYHAEESPQEDMSIDSMSQEEIELSDDNVVNKKRNETLKSTEPYLPSSKTNISAYFDAIWEDYKDKIITQLPIGKSRSDLIIRYYKHPKDGDRIKTLKTLRVYIHERPINKVMLPYESNAVFYGDSVATDDLQLTIYKLVNAGFPIKKVSLSAYHDSWKTQAIEIGTDTTIMDRAILSLDEISSLH